VVEEVRQQAPVKNKGCRQPVKQQVLIMKDGEFWMACSRYEKVTLDFGENGFPGLESN
jgi:hypothetical protein